MVEDHPLLLNTRRPVGLYNAGLQDGLRSVAPIYADSSQSLVHFHDRRTVFVLVLRFTCPWLAIRALYATVAFGRDSAS